MDYTTTCELCGKEYENYHLTFYILENGEKTRVCKKCRKSFIDNRKYVFVNYVPGYCDGCDSIARSFNTEEELLEYINANTEDGTIACMGDNNIIDVYKNKKFWWVRGYSTLTKGKLPNWKDMVISLHGEI